LTYLGGLQNLCQNFKDINHNQTDEDPIYDLPPDENLDYQSIENSAAAGKVYFAQGFINIMES